MPQRPGLASRYWVVPVLAVFTACTEVPTTVTDAESAALAKGGGGGGGGGGKVEINSTDPAGATQDTTLDVTVFGSGFESTDVANFLLDRKATPNIQTNSTTFVSSTELIANITIGIDADTSLYDVEVASSGGRRRGIGTQLFQVKAKNGKGPSEPIAMRVTFPAMVREGGPENPLLGDGQLPEYDHAICGVRALLGDEGDGQVGMNFQAFDNALSFGKKKLRDAQQACDEMFPDLTVVLPRTYTLVFARDLVIHDSTQALGQHGGDTLSTGDPLLTFGDLIDSLMVVDDPGDGITAKRFAVHEIVPMADTSFGRGSFTISYCDPALRFRPGFHPHSNKLEVEKVGEVFHVRSEAGLENVAWCRHVRSDGTIQEFYVHFDVAWDMVPLGTS